MQITRRQRFVLNLLSDRGSMSEREFHVVLSVVRKAFKVGGGSDDHGELSLYNFCADLWQKVDERFAQDEGGADSLSRELHRDIVDMEGKGYVLRNPDDPMIMRVQDPEFLHGIWYNPSLYGGFEMIITGRRQRDGKEEIGGEITDNLGSAHFFGERTQSSIRFTKKYDEGHHPWAGRGDIVYKGTRRGVDWIGPYTYMDHGEIPKTGKFILTGKENDLPGMEELLRTHPL